MAPSGERQEENLGKRTFFSVLEKNTTRFTKMTTTRVERSLARKHAKLGLISYVIFETRRSREAWLVNSESRLGCP